MNVNPDFIVIVEEMEVAPKMFLNSTLGHCR